MAGASTKRSSISTEFMRTSTKIIVISTVFQKHQPFHENINQKPLNINRSSRTNTHPTSTVLPTTQAIKTKPT
ncbi:hypothetical protein [Ornithinibacillus californiensis]|uniref:hypothetical protein n=1 Tax=Ornithinibacillus californiensis TaxID=161536 RepID=UPI0012EE33B1|nr:hypothetical protein [Ornithinibacillus californiensis]